MIEEIRNIKSGKRELRQFGLTVGVVLGLLGGVLLLRQKEYYHNLFAASAILIIFGLMAPKILRPIQKIWMALAVMIGWVMSRVILAVLFYLVITPTGILLRLLGKRTLDLSFKQDADSYWIERAAGKVDRKSYEQQY